MEQSISFLIVEDDEASMLLQKRLIISNYPKSQVYTAKDGLEGWTYINSFHPQIVISDYSMPGMDGIKLCQKVRSEKKFDDVIFIILTATTDIEKKLYAIEAGADEFINKPVANEEYLARLRSASRIVTTKKQLEEENKLLNELAAELEKDIEDMTRLAIKFLQARIPASLDMLKQVSETSVWIARQLEVFDEDEIRDVEIAGYLCLAGKVFLPDDMLRTPVVTNGTPTNQIMYQVPVLAKDIISSVRRFKDVGQILYHIYENFDGSGFPERIQSWQIPLGSRIIRVALEYQEMRERTDKKPRDIITLLQNEAKRLYDHRVIILLDQYIRTVSKEGYDPSEKAIQIHELKEGMVLTRDLITNSGLKLIPSGALLNKHIIERIYSHNSSDSILGYIYVKK